MGVIEQRSSKRVHFSLIPDYFDMIEVVYPNTTTEIYIYSMVDDGDGSQIIKGVIEVKYTTDKKRDIEYVKRT